jgi:hypothetical protein
MECENMFDDKVKSYTIVREKVHSIHYELPMRKY